jgi:ATP-dependent Zn protease
MRKGWKTLAVWILLIVMFLAIWQVLQPGTHGGEAESGGGGAEAATPFWANTVVTLLPMLFIGIMFFLFMRRLGAGSQNIFSLRKTTARLLATAPDVTFADVGGAGDCKLRLREVVEFLKSAARFEASGLRLPTGVLLEGPPGCGKTLLARAVAGEAKVPFFEVSASEFVELFVGVGAARVRDLFEEAGKKAPSIVFIDEIDAVGRRRGAGVSGLSHQEREQTLNQLLTNLDGFRKARRVMVIAATNRADILDAALLRPGRFDLRLKMPALSAAERAEVLAVHTRKKALDPSVDLEELAARTAGFSGAELEHLTNEAAIGALRRARAAGGNDAKITAADFDTALAARTRNEGRFDRLDAALIESTSQLAQPTGRVRVRASLEGGDVLEGDLVWLDATFMKIRARDGASTLVSKARIAKLEALEGTEAASLDDVVEDRWARQSPDAA